MLPTDLIDHLELRLRSGLQKTDVFSTEELVSVKTW